MPVIMGAEHVFSVLDPQLPAVFYHLAPECAALVSASLLILKDIAVCTNVMPF